MRLETLRLGGAARLISCFKSNKGLRTPKTPNKNKWPQRVEANFIRLANDRENGAQINMEDTHNALEATKSKWDESAKEKTPVNIGRQHERQSSVARKKSAYHLRYLT